MYQNYVKLHQYISLSHKIGWNLDSDNLHKKKKSDYIFPFDYTKNG